MPHINIWGDVTSGELGPELIVDGRPIYGGHRWWTPDKTINQSGCGTTGCVLAARDIYTGEMQTLLERASSECQGNGNGDWSSHLAGVDSITATGRHYPYVGAIGPGGEVAVKLGGAGPWDVVDRMGALLFHLTDRDAFDIQLLGGQDAIWRDSPQPEATIRTHGVVPIPQTIGPAYGIKMLLVVDRWWAMYQSGRVVIHPYDATGAGYDVTSGPSYGRDLRLISSISRRRARIASAVSPAQNQASVRTIDLELVEAHTNPIPPKPKPPEPPKPEPPSPYHKHSTKGLKMQIDGKTVVLRGPAGRLGRPDAINTGPWASLGTGWRGIIWDGDDPKDTRYHHTAHQVNGGNYTYTNSSGGLAGADATKYSGGINQQFYYKPDGDIDAGGYETWCTYDGNENGAIEAQIEYTDPAPFFSCPMAVEVV